MFWIVFTILVAIIIFLFYKWSTATFHKFNGRNIPCKKPIPLFGNFPAKFFIDKYSYAAATIDWYQQFKGQKVYGVFHFRDCDIFIRDPLLINRISIKDFDSFSYHKNFFDETGKEIFSKNLFLLRDLKWKETRNTLTPSFTISKLRLMFELMNQFCLDAVSHIGKQYNVKNINDGIDIEMKDYFKRFSNDMITSTAFGIKTNSYENKNDDFFQIGNAVTQFKGFKMFKVILYCMIPKIMTAIGFKVFDDDEVKCFQKLVFETIKYRQKHNIIRPDVIHHLVEARKKYESSKLVHCNIDDHATFNDDEMAAQCLFFFFSGFEHLSTSLCFTTYELAMNQDVQTRLYEEILNVENVLNGEPLTYEELNKMKYMDMVVSESLRLWPPAIYTDRCCTVDHMLYDENDNFICEIKKGEVILFPIMAIHRDPDYYQNPQKFDPERFSDANKAKINPIVYIPFGVGLRSCIGNRFALMAIKAIIYHILLRYKLVPGKNTVEDLLNELNGFQMEPPHGFWLQLKPRTEK